MMRVVLLFLLLSFVGSQMSPLYIQFGDSLDDSVLNRLLFLVQSSHNPVYILKSDDTLPDEVVNGTSLLSFGTTFYSKKFIDYDKLKILGDESFIVQCDSFVFSKEIRISYCVTDGLPGKLNYGSNIGLHFGSYEILNQLGYAFLHPLEPILPPSIIFPKVAINVAEKPYWESRGVHIHSMHPLELTNLLNGFGEQLSTDQDKWEIMIPYFNYFIEWMIANKQNSFEWVLLYASDWSDFANSTTRQNRLKILNEKAHKWGIITGADIPIAEQQQHSWYMTTNEGTLEEQLDKIYNRIDWIVTAGFDFLSSESGFSEFTHPSDIQMLSWMNHSAIYISEKYNKKMYIKCHCSTGQTCEHYKDPFNTSLPLNFNELPYYADMSLGIYPHTVQLYTFFDPTAGTYGNTNFTYMFNFTVLEAKKGRDTIYHGETAYWVNYDINVPLFLPSYAYARIFDMKIIAQTEIEFDFKLKGQMNFNSGWEWSYWLNDVLTAQVSWNPLNSLSVDDTLSFYLNKITSIFGIHSNEISNILFDLIQFQRETFIYGKINGEIPSEIIKRNGMAYLAGWDTWSDIGCDFSTMSCTQPTKLGLDQLRLPFQVPNYDKYVRPLLLEITQKLDGYRLQLNQYSDTIPSNSAKFYNEITDSLTMTYLRSLEVFSLYEYVNGWLVKPDSWRKEQIDNAKEAIMNATDLVKLRESQYRVPTSIIASWNNNPTCYTFGYLWSVHSLYFWYRDYEKAVNLDLDTLSPCFMNLMNPIDVAFGEGIGLNLTEVAREVLDKLGMLEFIADCLAAPQTEPHYNL